jgi:hypothetical protein
MARILQDFKLASGDQVGEILWEISMPEGVTVESVVRDRMRDHFAAKGRVQGVRVIDSETGEEIYRWTWWNEQRRHNEEGLKRLRETAEKELRKREGPNG